MTRPKKITEMANIDDYVDRVNIELLKVLDN